MKSIFLMPDSDPVRSYSLDVRKQGQKEESLAKNRPILASRRLVQSMFQVILATRKLVQTLSAFLLHKRPFSRKEPVLRKEMEGCSCPFSRRRSLGNSVSKMVTRMVRRRDQDERQSDGAMHWDTIRPVLLKAFAETWSTRFLRKVLVIPHS